PDLRCVLIFDTLMNRFISGSGYLAADYPQAEPSAISDHMWPATSELVVNFARSNQVAQRTTHRMKARFRSGSGFISFLLLVAMLLAKAEANPPIRTKISPGGEVAIMDVEARGDGQSVRASFECCEPKLASRILIGIPVLCFLVD